MRREQSEAENASDTLKRLQNEKRQKELTRCEPLKCNQIAVRGSGTAEINGLSGNQPATDPAQSHGIDMLLLVQGLNALSS